MRPLPEDDLRLAAFLKAHRPPVPPSDPALEEQLLAAIATTPQEIPTIAPQTVRQLTKRRRGWVLPGAIAASLVVTAIGYQTLRPQPQPTAELSAAELAELETFIESTWQDPVAEQPVVYADELFTQPDAAPGNSTMN